MKNKSNSTQNSHGESKAAPNVTALRKLFETNFKISNLTNPFKSKNNHSSAKSAAASKLVPQEEAAPWPAPSKSAKENRAGVRRFSSPGDKGCYVDCKIENCCCKTFFRQYDGTPNFRQPAATKLPLQERNSNSTFDRHRPERWSAASSSSYNLSKERQQLHHRWKSQPAHCQSAIHDTVDKTETRQNRYYISYDFYRSKAHEIFDETPVSAVSIKRLKSTSHKAGRSVNLLEKITKSETDDDGSSDHSNGSTSHSKSKVTSVPFHRSKASGFVNFTTTSLSEGGYIKSTPDFSTFGKVASQHSGNPDNKGVRITETLIKPLPKLGTGIQQEGGNRQEFHNKANSEASVLPKRFQIVKSEDNAYEELLHKLDLGGKSFGKVLQESESHRVGGFGFKHRIPKLKNIALREHTHPYSVKKPRLTVKGVKNRNMRNIQRRLKLTEQKGVARSQTFSGYDNFAYHRSITDMHLPKVPENRAAAMSAVAPDGDASSCGFDEADACGSSSRFDGPVCRPRPASISVVGVDDGPQFHLDSRMTSYNWPVTSFYIERDEELSVEPRRSSSSMDLSAKPSGQEKSQNPVARKSTLKRHCSLGYLENEFYEYNFTRQRRSLENISSKCEHFLALGLLGLECFHLNEDLHLKIRKFVE